MSNNSVDDSQIRHNNHNHNRYDDDDNNNNSNNNNNTSVLDLLSFEAETCDIMPTTTTTTTTTSSSYHQPRPIRMQGVLWKRRDVFRNRWRPRWFVLHPEQQILTYYLLSGNGNHGSSEAQQQQQQQPQQPQQQVSSNNSNSNNNNNVSRSNRRRTYSESSNISENTVDYDVVPRGTIYLLGSTVEANEALTRPDEELFVLSISDHEHATHVHLAARTQEARSQWITHIRTVCRQSSSMSSSSPRSHSRTTTTPNNRSTLRNTDMHTTPPRNSNYGIHRNNRTALSPSTPLYNQTLLESPSMMSHGTADNSVTASEWKMLYTDRLFENVPQDLQNQIETVLQTYLPHVEDLQNQDWKVRSSDANGIHCSVRRDVVTGQPLMRSIRQNTKHHPVEYLNLVWDLSKAMEYETNVRSQRLLKSYNANTSLVYKAYDPVWPTSPRDFATAAFWTLLQRSPPNAPEERALCALAVSCPQAEDALSDNDDDNTHVRGTLHVALNFWKTTPQGTYHARILSFQLNGRIPPTLTQTVLEQQSNLPRVMDTYLTKENKEQPLQHKLEYTSIYNVMDQMNKNKNKEKDDVEHFNLDRTESKIASFQSVQHVLSSPLTVENEAMVLLTPLVLYKLLSIISIRCAALCFAVGFLLALQWTIRRHLLTVFRVLPKSQKQKLGNFFAKGSTSCRFNVDLKGVLRFLANEKEAGEDHIVNEPEILISHILVRALGKAMSQLSHLAARQYTFMPPLYAVDVVFHDHKTSKAIWIDRPDEMTVQEIAEFFTRDQPPKTLWQTAMGPTCHIFTSPDSDHAQVDLDVVMERVPITVCVSGIRLEKENRQPSLCVAITILSTDIDECRAFAETVQKLIQFPEMLD
ncbi:PH domain containing protein [Nitzschia inconspicua]|uniref:PH domain containing protein n=1 Tax=Nitzschia inconspicua TaxID=303405 RepID=A0A9K3L1R1_9STRA|nr:PH domain containing protein [Nitzschia inconspicua]